MAKMKSKNVNVEGTILPSTAVIVKVTNVLTPYIIRICETQDYEERLNVISKKLILLKQRGMFDVAGKDVKPKIGDAVVVCDKLDNDIELPAWLCRGNICNIVDDIEETYNILLIDYGICVHLKRDNFVTYSTELISEESLSSTFGLYNILPADTNNDLSIENIPAVVVLEEWSESSIEYTKELVASSKAVYFNHLVSDEYGKQYGEFYLDIENSVITLSKALVLNNYAIFLQKELLKFIKHPTKFNNAKKKIINDEVVFCLDIAQECKHKNESPNPKERYTKKINQFLKKKNCNTALEKEREKVLIYGSDKYECLTSVLDAQFPAEIHKAWKSLVQSPNPRKIQSYIWPAIKKGLDVIAISPPKSGKTFGSIFAICGLLATNPSLPSRVSPSALILCSTSYEVLEVHSLCMEFLQSYKTIKSVAAFNGKLERSLVAEMFNGCQILISTPKFMVRFLNKNKTLINFDKLRYLMLDNGDTILDEYFDAISQLFKKYQIICNRDLKNKNAMLQIIITAKNWTLPLKKVASVLMYHPYVCISSFIEAVIFKSVRPKVYIMNSKNKCTKVLDLVGTKYPTVRTAIICINREEAEELAEFLKQSEEILFAHENINLVHLQGIKQCWDACVNGSYPILICTDEVLADMNITNIIWLIHYSISLHSKTQFNFRFSTVLDSLEMEKCNCEVTIIADENNDVQFLSIIKILQRMNVSISPNMLENIEQIRISLEHKKNNYPICNNVKSWGFCQKKESCAFRHRIIADIDAPILNLRVNDKVKFRVIRIHDVVHMFARIVSYIKFDSLEEIECSGVEFMKLFMKMQEFYSHIENRKRYKSLDVGNICGLEDPIDSFKRVKILKIEKDKKTDIAKFVDVKCIDNGVTLRKVNAYRLLYMPEEFVRCPPQVMEIFLVGIVPHDKEYVWNYCAINTVHQWFEENVDEESYLIAKVNLHLGNTIWVNTIEVGTKLIGYKDVIGSSLKTVLLEKDHAVENDSHLSQMYQLCKDAGLKDFT